MAASINATSRRPPRHAAADQALQHHTSTAAALRGDQRQQGAVEPAKARAGAASGAAK
jgi:hypothetical protein